MNTQTETHSGPNAEQHGDPCANRKSQIENPGPLAITSNLSVRNGKIARLPSAIRAVVNEMLQDSRYYREIVARLAELGYPGIRPQNLSEWYKGGYQDWLKLKTELEDLRHDQVISAEMAADPNAAANLAKANEILLSLRLNHLLTDPNSDNLGNTLRFMRLARLIAHEMRESNRRSHHQFDPRARNPTLSDQIL